MKFFRKAAALCVALVVSTAALAGPMVEMKTNLGSMTIELYPEKAPKSVENFLQYVKDGFFKGTIFHRVIPGFMAQGGGLTAEFQQKDVREPIRNEADNGLKNTRGTLAMARTQNPHSATAQFFVNVSDNAFLDYTAPNSRGWGYAVFGKVVKGLDVVDAIVQVPTGDRGPFQNVPITPVVIEDVRIVGK